MNASHPCSGGKLLLTIIACSFLVSGPVNAGGHGDRYRGYSTADNAQLQIWRAADFGYWISMNIYIDGVMVTSLAWNQSYQALVRPGEHVLSLITTPSPYGKTRVTYHKVHMKPGETYAFTALWREAQLPALEKGHVRVASTGW